jgi:hypothetical protein
VAELDLQRGEADEDEGRSSSKPRGQSERSSRRHRADIKERLYAIFARLADSLEGRGDLELAGIIREDSRAMVEGLASLVKRAPGFAPPILGVLAVLEPLIAFGRILRLLGRRLRDRREAGPEEGWDAGDEAAPESEAEAAERLRLEHDAAAAAAAGYEEPAAIAEPWRLEE